MDFRSKKIKKMFICVHSYNIYMQYCQLCKHYGMVHLSAYFGALEKSEPNSSLMP